MSYLTPQKLPLTRGLQWCSGVGQEWVFSKTIGNPSVKQKQWFSPHPWISQCFDERSVFLGVLFGDMVRFEGMCFTNSFMITQQSSLSKLHVLRVLQLYFVN